MVISAMMLCAMGSLAPVLDLKNADIASLSARLKAETRRPLKVRLSGRVELSQPIVIGPEANGVTIEGNATLSGGVQLKNWRVAGNTWTHALPFTPGSLRQLFVGNQRWARPTLPAKGEFYRFADFASQEDRAAQWNVGQSAMIYAEGTLNPAWRNRDDVEVVAYHFWVTSRMKIKEWDTASRKVTFDRGSIFKLADDGWGADAKASVFRVENVREALHQPQTFYWDRTLGEIQTQTPIKEAVAPRIPEVLRVQGAKDVTISGLTFAHTEYDKPGSAGDVQAGHTVPASVTLVDCQGVKVEKCKFVQIGNWGVEVVGASKNNTIRKSTFDDMGAGGIKLGDKTVATTVEDNTITRGGRLVPSACGIWGGLTGHNVIRFNTIHDMYYTGISLGWDWGFRDTDAKENLIANNDISLIGQGQLSDMGGIYVLGKQPGSQIRHNRIRQVFARGYGGWGIYLDEGSTGWTVANNLVVDTKTGGFHIHYGGHNVIEDNIFIGARSDGQLIRSRDDQQGPITFLRNVVVALDPKVPIVTPSWLRRDVKMANNIFWSPSPDRTMPFGADASNRWEDPKLDKNGVPTIPLWFEFDVTKVGARR